MQTVTLGRSSFSIGRIGLGEMPLSIDGRPSEADAVRVIHAALDAGVTLIDTADAYCLDERDVGHGERLVARALRTWSGGAPGSVLVATKGGCERPGGQWTVNGRPEHLVAACEASLTALGVATIGLYQLHAVDPRVPLAESLGALVRLQEQGKILHLGVSNVNAGELEVALSVAHVVSVQNRCNFFERGSFRGGVVAACERRNVTFLAHSPVGGHRGHRRTAADPTLAAVAARHGATPYQIALAWLLSASPSIVPIPGASRVESIRSSVAAARIVLAPPEKGQLDAAAPA